MNRKGGSPVVSGVVRWRTAHIAAVLGVLGALGLVEAAGAGTYTVFQCSSSNTGSGNPGGDPNHVRLGGAGGDYVPGNACGTPNPAIGIHNPGRASRGQERRWTWSAPAGASIVRANVRADLRDNAGYSARVFTSLGDLVVGDDGFDGWVSKQWSFGGVSTFGVRLVCGYASGCDSNGSTRARAYLSNIALTVNDTHPPSASATGALMDSGWHRGIERARISASDFGGGVSAYALYVNGTKGDAAFAPCARTSAGYAARMRPCGNVSVTSGAGNTANPLLGWEDGANSVQVCAWDFSGTRRCAAPRQVNVDNTAPALAFRNSQSPADPELVRVRVAERHSGVDVGKISFRREGAVEWQDLPTGFSGGELRARVDSESVPAGRYEFKAWAQDRAGNRSGEVDYRENAQPMVLNFPLRAAAELRAGIGDGASSRTVRYGKPAQVTGRLRSADHDPLAFETVIVEERYVPGSLDVRHTSEAVTGKDGRFALPLPAGPSREVRVSYPGSRRYRPSGAGRLDFNVRSGVRFRTSSKRVRPGKPVTFGGKVKHGGASIPRGGKLVELQVKEGAKRWGTVKEAFSTREDGRYSLRYRFGEFYTRPVSFKFRVKVTREQGWPYKAPVRSRARAVTVVP